MDNKGRSHQRSEVLDAIYVLNDLADCFKVGTSVFNEYQSRFKMGQLDQPGIVGVQKMCVSHLVIGLFKICEFWKEYKALIPTELRPEVKALVSDLEKRGVVNYRNTVVAHVRDKKLRRTPTQYEAMELLNQISDGHPSRFLLRLFDPKDNTYPKTVASIVVKLRDRLRELHGVTPEEVFKR
jgi:hypothetical protein